MADLIKRLQEAESGSRELDAAMAVALDIRADWAVDYGEIYVHPKANPGDVSINTTRGKPSLGHPTYPAPYPTTSLDSIVALIGEKLPGFFWSVHERPDGYAASLDPMDRKRVVRVAAFSTAPIALCIALLTALQSQEPTP